MRKIGLYSFLIAVWIICVFLIPAEIDASNRTIEYFTLVPGEVSVQNDTNLIDNLTETLVILDFIPKNFKTGDVQFNIKIQNNHSIVLNNIVPIISGKGFSTYNVVPIASLQPGEKDYVIVSGNFKESGTITLTIKIGEEIFYQDLIVEDIVEKELEKEKEDKKGILTNLSLQLLDLKQKYYQLESNYFDKKDRDYDLSNVNLDEIKSYIQDIEIDLINEDIKGSTAKIKLAYESYENQKKKLEISKQKSSLYKLKDYSLIFSTIAGAMITFFALSELLKKKSKKVVGTIKKVSFNEKTK